jgi:hypothetical protein
MLLTFDPNLNTMTHYLQDFGELHVLATFLCRKILKEGTGTQKPSWTCLSPTATVFFDAGF